MSLFTLLTELCTNFPAMVRVDTNHGGADVVRYRKKNLPHNFKRKAIHETHCIWRLPGIAFQFCF